MTGLSAISPDRGGVIDGEGPAGEVGCVGSNWHEARIEPDPLAGGLIGQRQARSSE